MLHECSVSSMYNRCSTPSHEHLYESGMDEAFSCWVVSPMHSLYPEFRNVPATPMCTVVAGLVSRKLRYHRNMPSRFHSRDTRDTGNATVMNQLNKYSYLRNYPRTIVYFVPMPLKLWMHQYFEANHQL